jgi:ATP-dependent DNA ligase
VCDHDADGIVCEGSRGPYHIDGRTTSWLKIKNPTYSQAVGRHELFERRQRDRGRAPAR